MAIAPEQPEVPPALPLEAWEPTKDTLHLYAQIVGKVRLAATPARNHWWNAPLYVDARGLTTGLLRRRGRAFAIDFDFVDHLLVVRTTRGETETLPLGDGLSVAQFHDGLFTILARLGVEIEIDPRPYGVPMTTPFPDDEEHASYDRVWVERFWRSLDWIDWVLEEFAGWFSGKTSPVHLFWHSFDLALTRFSGRRAPANPNANEVTREAYSHEVISFGFWAGDQTMRAPAFYSYTAPEPAGLARQPLQPETARWKKTNGTHLAVLGYEDVRTTAEPRETLLAFLQSAYDAGASLAGWDRDELATPWCPATQSPA